MENVQIDIINQTIVTMAGKERWSKPFVMTEKQWVSIFSQPFTIPQTLNWNWYVYLANDLNFILKKEWKDSRFCSLTKSLNNYITNILIVIRKNSAYSDIHQLVGVFFACGTCSLPLIYLHNILGNKHVYMYIYLLIFVKLTVLKD